MGAVKQCMIAVEDYHRGWTSDKVLVLCCIDMYSCNMQILRASVSWPEDFHSTTVAEVPTRKSKQTERSN